MVGVGVIGYGYWGPNVARNLASLDGCDLRVICDADPLALDKISRLYPRCRTTTDCDEVFAAPDVDAVAICTPVHTHFPLAMAALEAGLHVLVEKPLTNSLDSARALTELARKRNRVLQVDHTFVYSGAVQTIRSMIDAGELGDLLYVDSVRINLGLFQSDVSVIWDLAAHDVSIISSLIDARPEWVSAVGSSHYGQFENLADVVRFYSTLEDRVGMGHHQESILVPLNLDEGEIADLVVFLESLTGRPLDPALLRGPDSPLLDE